MKVMLHQLPQAGFAGCHLNQFDNFLILAPTFVDLQF